MELSKIEKLEKIVQFNTLMNQTHDFDNLLNLILVQTEKMFHVEGTAIFLEDEDTGTLFFYIATGEKKDILKTIRMKKDEGVCGHVFMSGKPFIENHPERSKIFSDKADKKSNFKTKNILAVPLQINDNRIGVIELVNKIKGDFNDDDEQFLKAVATQVSLTLDKQRIIEEQIRSERLASMGETVAGLAHYIKNILNGLKGGAFIIDKNIHKLEQQSIKTGWDMVQKNIERISELTMDMLLYSKNREPEYSLVNINDLINDVIDLEKERAEQRNIKIVREYSEKIGVVEIDPKGIHRSLLNLISNAIDALQDIENATIRIKTKIGAGDKNFFIEITDNGMGMPEEIRKKLFTKFMSTKGSKGTGLGLKITKKIIMEHLGSIRVRSKKNVGTTFVIKLPIKRIKIDEENQMKKKIILAVDDEMDSIEFIKSVVENDNIDFYYANDGDEGVQKAKELLPDLIILDVQMPKQDGFVTFWELRKDEATKNIPVVILTGIRQTLGARFSKEKVGDLVGEEPNYYLDKPIDPAKLQDIVSEVLN